MYHFKPARTANKKTITSAGENVEGREPSWTVGGLYVNVAPMENSVEDAQKNKKAISLLNIYPKKTKTLI